MARRRSDIRKIRWIKGYNDDPSARRIALDRINGSLNLVNSSPRPLPRTPLLTVHGPEIAVSVGPLIPDGDLLIFEILNVGIAFKKPEELVYDRFKVNLLRRDKRKSVRDIESHLPTKHRVRPDSGAIRSHDDTVFINTLFRLSVLKDIANKI